ATALSGYSLTYSPGARAFTVGWGREGAALYCGLPPTASWRDCSRPPSTKRQPAASMERFFRQSTRPATLASPVSRPSGGGGQLEGDEAGLVHRLFDRHRLAFAPGCGEVGFAQYFARDGDASLPGGTLGRPPQAEIGRSPDRPCRTQQPRGTK